ncbi:unnamed protein product [Soboliphyme baturini]|uniref:Secreted protein n=1 Tax=Soboliphyme baturini TaxID=241478 RepID=A0A183J7A5_9BILA|nr:unnamed protein product [Soboliphyme baturini]
MAVKGERLKSGDVRVTCSSALIVLLAASTLTSVRAEEEYLAEKCTKDTQSFSLVEFVVSLNETVAVRASIFQGGSSKYVFLLFNALRPFSRTRKRNEKLNEIPRSIDISSIDAYFNRFDGSYSAKKPDWFVELVHDRSVRLGILIFDRDRFTNVVKMKSFAVSRSRRFRDISNDCVVPKWEHDPFYTATDLCHVFGSPLRVGRCPTGKGLPGDSVCGTLKKTVAVDDCVSISLASVFVPCIWKTDDALNTLLLNYYYILNTLHNSGMAGPKPG